jgi:GT2 family glycosyltransferase
MENKNTLILILNWKKYQDTLDCLSSLMKADLSGADILVIDNASRNGSVQNIKATFPHIPLIENIENLGFAGGNNVGIRYAIERQYEFVMLLNSDTTVDRNFLQPLVQMLSLHPKIGAVQSLLLNAANPLLIDTLGQVAYQNGFVFDISPHEELSSHQSTLPNEIFGACAAAALYRTKILAQTGGFDERFFVIYEDVDLSWNIRLSNHTTFLIRESIVYHKRGISVGHGSPISAFYFNRNHLLLSVKYLPIKYLLKYAPLFSWHFFKVLFYAHRLGKKKTYFELIKLLIKSWRKRSQIQQNPLWQSICDMWLQKPEVSMLGKLKLRLYQALVIFP